MDHHDRSPPWQPGTERYPALAGHRRTDVCVVGAGITGLTTALELLERGRSVTVLESHSVGAGSTGRSTGKVTSQHGMHYAELLARHGHDVARAYADAAQGGVERVRQLVAGHDIDCDLEEVASHLHVTAPARRRELETEARAAAALGLPARSVTDAPVPHPVLAAVRFDHQLQLDPWRYVSGLARAVVATGGTVHEDSRVTGVRRRAGRVEVTTPRGTVDAGHVVVATLLPTVDPAATFARVEPTRAYGVAATVGVPVPRDNAITAAGPSRSTRRAVDRDGTELLVVVGASHEVGHAQDHATHLDALERYAAEVWGPGEVRYRWSAQDHVGVDGLPSVGSAPWHPRLLLVTGLRKWGLTLGTAAARILADELTGDGDGGPFSPVRRPRLRDLPKLVALNAANGAQLLRGRVPPRTTAAPTWEHGVVIPDLRHPRAVSLDAEGRRCELSAVCPHLGCTVAWNPVERSWDCPCHGSRFAPDGTVLDGPADRPLRRLDR